MTPLSTPKIKVELNVNADHSCNWRCCFGCRCAKGIRRLSSDSEIKVEKVAEEKGIIHGKSE